MTLIMKPGIRLANDYTRPDDPDAVAYIAAVEAADTAAGQTGGLETATKMAINAFVKGCKADGIWPAIKASCILAGARTLSGALVPLIKQQEDAAPARFGTEGGWAYNRKTGLQGNGTNNYIDSGRANNKDPQDSQHLSVYASSVGTSAFGVYIGDATAGQTGASYFYRSDSGQVLYGSCRTAAEFSASNGSAGTPGMFGINRSSSSSYAYRTKGSTTTVTQASSTPTTGNVHVFRLNRGFNNLNTNACLAFYSIGDSLNLALLDARVTTLINAIGAAF